jgi:hypothetical protein
MKYGNSLVGENLTPYLRGFRPRSNILSLVFLPDTKTRPSYRLILLKEPFLI